MRFMLLVVFVAVLLSTLAYGGRRPQSAVALGVPSQLPFHWRVPFVARDGFPGVVESDLATAETRWGRFGGSSYRINLVLSTYPISERHTVYISRGQIGDIFSDCTLGGEPIACARFDASPYTVLSLFALVRSESAKARTFEIAGFGQHFVDVMYDQALGYPVRIEYGLRGVEDQITTVIVEDLVVIQP